MEKNAVKGGNDRCTKWNGFRCTTQNREGSSLSCSTEEPVVICCFLRCCGSWRVCSGGVDVYIIGTESIAE
jgi:hypothetical protein